MEDEEGGSIDVMFDNSMVLGDATSAVFLSNPLLSLLLLLSFKSFFFSSMDLVVVVAFVVVAFVVAGDDINDATVVNVGTSSAAKFDFGIPRGADGALGAALHHAA